MEFNLPKTLCLYLLSLLILTTSSIEVSDSSSSSAEVILRFQKYLQINTAQPTPQCHEAADFLLSQARSLSLESQTTEFVNGKPLVLLKWPGSNPDLPTVLLYSHTDVVPSEHNKWTHQPFSEPIGQKGNIYARGSQDMKCVGMHYLEIIRRLKASGFLPLCSIYLSFAPDEEIGGHDGAEGFAESEIFDKLNVGLVLDEGRASPGGNYRAFYVKRSSWWLVIKATGGLGHGAKLYDNTAMETLSKSIESIRRFRASQFDMTKAGLKAKGKVISANLTFLKAGTRSPTKNNYAEFLHGSDF